MGIFAIVRGALTIGSVLYQNKKRKRLEAQQRALEAQQLAAADARKGQTFAASGEAAPLPVIYGKNMLGGITVRRNVTSTYTARGLTGTTFSNGMSNATRAGTKNEYLHLQHALCHDGIEGVVSVKVNSSDYSDADQGFSHIIRTYSDGGTADPIATANGLPATNRFTGTAFASSTFKLNRDDPQYNGEPSMDFIVKGRRVRSVVLSGGVYSVSSSYTYSNNPALCLLDYLLNNTFGRGLSVNEVDLESFYNSAIVCGTTVVTNRRVGGVVNGGATTRNIPLYECNIALSSEGSIRDNIERIMDTMALAELTWSTQGKYKLSVEYPTSKAEQDALVAAAHYFTDDDIIRSEVNISWPSASERLNQVTVNFLNEHEDFKSDSETWPNTFSTAHSTYLTEDNNQPFSASLTAAGVTDPYHARATAEQLVREARTSFSVDLTVSKKGLSVEPGDFINLTATNSGISDEVFRVQSIQVNADFTVKLTCSSFSHTMLAWNTNDNIAYSVRPTYDFSVEPVTSLVYNAGSPAGDRRALAELNWVAPSDGSFKAIVYYTDDFGDMKRIGETSSGSFLIYPRDEWANGQNVTFTVKAQTPLGRLSAPVTVTSPVFKTPDIPTSFSVFEELYQTNKASGVKAKATLSFSQPDGGIEPRDYRVEYYRVQDGPTYKLLGYTVSTDYVFDDVRSGDYYFRITPISWFDHEGSPLIGTKEIFGLNDIPADPTGLASKVTDTGILLTWDTPSDLDVVSGGTSEIRYSGAGIVDPRWETSQTLVNNISGTTTTAALPLAAGCYLLKHIDSSGNACAEPAKILNSFVGPDFNAITTIDEDPTFAGDKTNCEVVGGVLQLTPDSSGLVADYDPVSSVSRFAGPVFALDRSMTYLFDNSIDLGSVENIRLSPSITTVITDGTTTVSDYDPVSSISRFSGPYIDASVNFQIRTTEDDPSGSPTWSDWETFSGGNYLKRGFEFKLVGEVSSTGHTIEVSGLSLTADKADVRKRGTSSNAGGNTTVTFDTPFYGGIGGTDVPYVGVNTVGASSGSKANIISISNTGFVYTVSGGGSGTKLVTWQAVGQ